MKSCEVLLPVDLMVDTKLSESLFLAEYVKKLKSVMTQFHSLSLEKLVSYQKRHKGIQA